MVNPNINRLRRTMMFLNAQRPGLIKDAYIYRPDTLIFDLEDAVAENQKDAARFSLYHALKTVDYRGVERMVRINALDTPHWQEDIRVSVAAGCDAIRMAKCESAKDVHDAVEHIEKAEREFNKEIGSTLIAAALESPKAIINAYEICLACPERLAGVAISGSDYRKCLQVGYTPGGIEMLGGRAQIIIAARAAGVQCYDTVFTDLNDMEGFRAEVIQNKQMGFDGKSVINPRQIAIVHEIFAPSQKQIIEAEKIVRTVREQSAQGIGVFTVDGKMIDAAFLPGAERIIALAKASGVYEGDL